MRDQIRDFLQSKDPATQQFRILGYLTLSNFIGYMVSAYLLDNIFYTAVFAPVINYILWLIAQQLKKDGYAK